MVSSAMLVKELKAISQLLTESNDSSFFNPVFNNSSGNSINNINNDNNNNSSNNLKTNSCMCKKFDSNGFSPWLMDSDIISILQCRSTHASLDASAQNKEKNKNAPKTKDFRKALIRSTSGINETCLKFYHFDDVCEHMTHYRENITLPVLMQHRTKLTRSCGECQDGDMFAIGHDKDCNYTMKSPVAADNAWLSVAYVKQIESTLINRYYSDSPGVSVEAIIEQVRQRPIHTSDGTNRMRKAYLRRDTQTHMRRDLCARKMVRESESKMKRPPITPPKSCLRQQTVVLGKKSSASPQRKNPQTERILRLKTGGCGGEDIDALRVISATKMNIGPRMGSNFPTPQQENDSSLVSHGNRFQPSSSVRRKMSQMVITQANRSPSFQACVGPAVPNGNK